MARKLPRSLKGPLRAAFTTTSRESTSSEDEAALWLKIGGSPKLVGILNEEARKIVKGAALTQSLKGILTVGIGKSLRYSGEKIGKWWKGK